MLKNQIDDQYWYCFHCGKKNLNSDCRNECYFCQQKKIELSKMIKEFVSFHHIIKLIGLIITILLIIGGIIFFHPY